MRFYYSDDSEDSDQGPANDEPEVDSLAAAIQYEVSIIIIVVSMCLATCRTLFTCAYILSIS